MPITVQHRRASTPGKVPLTTQLQPGEIAVNLNDGLLYFNKYVGASNSVVAIGPTPPTANALTTARTISLTGDATGSMVFDGSINVTTPLTLALSGVVAGTYSNLVVDAKGRLTSARSLIATDISAAQGYTCVNRGGDTITGPVTLQGALTANTGAFSGTVTAANAVAGTNTLQVATTSFVQSALPVASSTAPLPNASVAVIGTSLTYARADHVHLQANTAVVSSFCDVSLNTNKTIAATGFNTIILDTVNTDVGGNYNLTTGIYTVPFTGLYQIATKVRINDGTSSNLSYGQGVHTSNIDGPWFQWFITVGGATTNRNGSLNLRFVRFLAGSQLRLYMYPDGFNASIGACSLNVILVTLG